MHNSIPEKLKKTIKEYYEYSGEDGAYTVKSVPAKLSSCGYEMILVRVTDTEGRKLSTLIDFTEWADGHYEVTEMYHVDRENEKELVKAFMNSNGDLFSHNQRKVK